MSGGAVRGLKHGDMAAGARRHRDDGGGVARGAAPTGAALRWTSVPIRVLPRDLLMQRLFVYGSLAPGRQNAHVLADVPGEWEPASVRGRLVEQGWGAAIGYPGIILDTDAGEVQGLPFSSDRLGAHWNRLDAFEGEGYRRVTVTALRGNGTRVDAHVYAIRDVQPG